MAFGNWEQIISNYRDVYMHTKYAEHAKGMLEVISDIQVNPAFKDLLPGTSHSTFFMKMPQSKTWINVWCERSGVYTVYLSHPDKGDYDVVTVASTDLIPTLQAYAERLRGD